MGNPSTEVARQVDDVHPVDDACPMLLVHELADEVVADQRREVRVAHCSVLGLRNENVLFFLGFNILIDGRLLLCLSWFDLLCWLLLAFLLGCAFLFKGGLAALRLLLLFELLCRL